MEKALSRETLFPTLTSGRCSEWAIIKLLEGSSCGLLLVFSLLASLPWAFISVHLNSEAQRVLKENDEMMDPLCTETYT